MTRGSKKKIQRAMHGGRDHEDDEGTPKMDKSDRNLLNTDDIV